MTKKEKQRIATAAKAFYNYPEFHTREWIDQPIDYIFMRAEEVRHQMAKKYGVSVKDILAYIAENAVDGELKDGNRNRA